MSSDVDEDFDSEGTSADTILKELCLLRCSSCASSTRNSSQVNSQFESTNFSSFCASEGTEILTPSSVVESPLASDSPQSLAIYDSNKHSGLSSDSTNRFKEKHIFFDELSDSRLFSNPWFKHLQNLVSQSNGSLDSINPDGPSQNKSESVSCGSQVEFRCRLNSIGTDTPNFERLWIARAGGLKLSDRSQQTSSPSESDGSSSVDCLLRERCRSPDCACDKGFRKTKRVPFKSRRLLRKQEGPRSVGSQVTETIHGLKLIGWDGQIIIKEDDLDLSMDPMRDGRMDSRESVPSVFDLCRVSTLSNQSSDSAITFLKKCSDSNLLTSLGLKQDESVLRNKMANSSKETNESKNKGQMVETYGKLLHKIEKFKRMTSWKSKKRKNKLKYTLEGPDFPEEQSEDKCSVNGNYVERADDMKHVDCMSCGDAVVDYTNGKEMCVDQTESRSKTAESKQDSYDSKRRTCEVATQSIQSVKSESFMTTIESSLDNINLQDDQDASVNNNIQTTSLQSSKNLSEPSKICTCDKDEERKSSRRLRPESAVSVGTCSLLQEVTKSLSSLGDRETQDEILEHLRQINNLIERESCASNSNYRLSKSERSLGLDINKSSKTRSSPKIEREKQETNKSRKDSRVYWAVTKVTVYPDSCRTYEVMRLSRRRPQNIPSSSDSVFVLLPNK